MGIFAAAIFPVIPVPQMPGFGNGEVSVAALGPDPGTIPGLFNPKNSSPNLQGETPVWSRSSTFVFQQIQGTKELPSMVLVLWDQRLVWR